MTPPSLPVAHSQSSPRAGVHQSSARASVRRRPLIAICGNPNCGKTTIFNALTRLSQRVANYPGVTVERFVGEAVLEASMTVDVVDIPGVYSLAANSPDESIATETLFRGIAGEGAPDLVVAVVDGANLERSLYLVLQLAALGRPLVIAVTMTDELARQRLELRAQQLQDMLGAPVVQLVANRGKGIRELRSQLAAVLQSDRQSMPENCYPPPVREILRQIISAAGNAIHSEAEALRILLNPDSIAARRFLAEYQPQDAALGRWRKELTAVGGSMQSVEAEPLHAHASRIAAAALQSVGDATGAENRASSDRYLSRSYAERIDRVVLHPVFGPVIFLGVMFLIFQSIFTWSAPLMASIDALFGRVSQMVGDALPPGALSSLITDGVISGVGGVLVFLPQIVLLFTFISLLEDSGYMPRAALIVDRLLGWCGLSGKSFIPMLSSFACAIPGIMATRTIEDRRVRMLTIMIAPLMSCSARLPVYTVMIAACIPATMLLGVVSLQGAVLLAMYLIGVFVAAGVAFLYTRLTGRNRKASFVMEMPRYQRPLIRSVALRVYQRARSFVLRAGTLILAISILIWAASYFPRSSETQQAFDSTRATINANANLTADDRAEQLRQVDQNEQGTLLRESFIGRAGRFLAPLFSPLGWDWKITMAALASFPAREVVVSTLSTIYNLGDADSDQNGLVSRLRDARWDSGPKTGQPVFTAATALSLMVFFALCCQCGATVMTIRQEIGSWSAAVLAFSYMSVLAYLGAWGAYRLASVLGWS